MADTIRLAMTSMAIIVYILWVILQRLIDGTINAIDDLQNLSEEALRAELDIIANNVPPLTKLFWGLNAGTSNLLDRLTDVVHPRLLQIRDQLLNTLLIIVIVGILLFLLSVTAHVKILTIFLSVLFLISGFLFLEIYAPILDVITHKRFRRSSRPSALINAYFFNLLIVCAYWYFVDYNTFIIALTVLSLWMLFLIGFGFTGHYFLFKKEKDGETGWYARESNAAGKALRFSAVAFMLVLVMIKFVETPAGNAVAGPIESVSKIALKKLEIIRSEIQGLEGYTNKKTEMYIFVTKIDNKQITKKLRKYRTLPKHTSLTFPESKIITIKVKKKVGKKVELVKMIKVIVNGKEGFIPESNVNIGPIPESSTITRLKITKNSVLPQSKKQKPVIEHIQHSQPKAYILEKDNIPPITLKPGEVVFTNVWIPTNTHVRVKMISTGNGYYYCKSRDYPLNDGWIKVDIPSIPWDFVGPGEIKLKGGDKKITVYFAVINSSKTS